MLKPLTVWITPNSGKFLKRWKFQTNLPASWENLYADHKVTVRTGHGTTDWFQIGKGIHQGCALSPCLFNLHAEYIMRNARLDEAEAGLKISRRNITNKIYRWHHSYDRKWGGTEESLDESERGEWKNWLKTLHSKSEDHGNWSHLFMANRWGNNRK